VSKKPVPWYYWPFWFLLLAAGLFVFYVLLTPVWVGIRLIEWFGHRRELAARKAGWSPVDGIEPEEGASAAFMFGSLGVSGEEAGRRPVRELYAAFSRPRNDADRRAGKLAASRGALDPGTRREGDPEPAHGAVLEEDGRLLLEGLGGEEDAIYAAPTANDYVALAVLPNGGGSWTVPGPDGLVLGWTSSPGGLVVHGLVEDEVDSVDVVCAGETHAARMGENAFGLRLEQVRPDDLERLVLRRRDGSESAIPLA
jgi:hypothetical protein